MSQLQTDCQQEFTQTHFQTRVKKSQAEFYWHCLLIIYGLLNTTTSSSDGRVSKLTSQQKCTRTTQVTESTNRSCQQLKWKGIMVTVLVTHMANIFQNIISVVCTPCTWWGKKKNYMSVYNNCTLKFKNHYNCHHCNPTQHIIKQHAGQVSELGGALTKIYSLWQALLGKRNYAKASGWLT